MLNANVDIDSKSIEELYDWYKKEVLIVNRRYQRKLVWSLEEKKALISSILESYPIPLLLFVRIQDSREILDGMQRLEAVMSFIEQRFDFDGKYFDLDSTAFTKDLKDRGILVQREPILERVSSTALARYKFAVSEYSSTEPDIDEVFRRINSSGKTLSSQELRSAGAISNYSELVRKVATTIRGDTSHSDVLNLNAMSTISIGNDNLNYGVCINDHFFVTNGILSRACIRESNDEELIANILGYIALDKKPPSGSTVLDDFYGIKDTVHSQEQREKLDLYIQRTGSSTISSNMTYVYEQIKCLFEDHTVNFKNHILGSDTTSQKSPRYYQAVFLAFYELLVIENKEISDPKALLEQLTNIGNTVIQNTGGGRWAAISRQKSIDDIKALIDRYFKLKPEQVQNHAWITEIDQILTSSRTEQANYDFKQGLVTLDGNSKLNEESLEQIVATCVGINNIGKDANGFVLIGVADQQHCAVRIKELYGVDAIEKNEFYITGIDHEATVLYGDLDKYLGAIKDKISALDFTENLKQQILKDIEVYDYKGFHLIKIAVKSVGSVCSLNNVTYLRQGTSTTPLTDINKIIALAQNYNSGL
ncbi:DUF262 domain-containing protein [Vibrio cyclitrophicus]